MINAQARMTDTEAVVVYDPNNSSANADSLNAARYSLSFFRGEGALFLDDVNREDVKKTLSYFVGNPVFPTRMVLAFPVQKSEMDARAVGGGAN